MKIQEIVGVVKYPELGEALDEYVRANLQEFKEVLEMNPVKDATGATSVSEAFWLYCLARDTAPPVIIESGTLYGWSLWFLVRAMAVSRDDWVGKIHSFDPRFAGEPTPDIQGVRYHGGDLWETEQVVAGFQDGFFFFDDHQDQGRRFVQARHLNAAHVVFHDNYLTPDQSHRPIRFCGLGPKVKLCYTFPPLVGFDEIFRSTRHNAQTYRWLTWIRLR